MFVSRAQRPERGVRRRTHQRQGPATEAMSARLRRPATIATTPSVRSAVLHDGGYPLAGAGAGKGVRRVGEGIDVEGAGYCEQHDDGENAGHRYGKEMSQSPIQNGDRPPDQDADDGEEGE